MRRALLLTAVALLAFTGAAHAEPARVATAEQKHAAMQAKLMLLINIEAGKESPGMRAALAADVRKAQEKFVTACRACASAQTCEADRLTIARGEGSSTYNPCD